MPGKPTQCSVRPARGATPPRAAANRPRAAAGMGSSGEDDRAAPVPRARAAPVLGTGAAMESSDEDAAAGVPPPIARVRGGGAGAGAQAQARKAEPPPRAAPAAKRPRSPGADARSAAGCPEGSGESQKGRLCCELFGSGEGLSGGITRNDHLAMSAQRVSPADLNLCMFHTISHLLTSSPQ